MMTLILWKEKIANKALCAIGREPLDNVFNKETASSRFIVLFIDDVIMDVLDSYKYEQLKKEISLKSLKLKDSDYFMIPPDLLRFVGLCYDSCLTGENTCDENVNFSILNGRFTFDSTCIYDTSFDYKRLKYTSFNSDKIDMNLENSIVSLLASKIVTGLGDGDLSSKFSLIRESDVSTSKAIKKNRDEFSGIFGETCPPFQNGRDRIGDYW